MFPKGEPKECQLLSMALLSIYFVFYEQFGYKQNTFF